MAPGTGLGLSLVRSIVNMLNGDISVESQIDIGTVVAVRIPMKKASLDAKVSEENMRHPAIESMRQLNSRPRIATYERSLTDETERQSEASQMHTAALSAYISGWYNLDELKVWDGNSLPDVLCVDEVHLPVVTDLLSKIEVPGPSLLVFCVNASRITAIASSVTYPKLHVVAKPFGPHKLAKALRLALNKGSSAGSQPGSSEDPAGTKTETLVHTRVRKNHRSNSGTVSGFQGGSKRSAFPSAFSSDDLGQHGSGEGFPFPLMGLTPAANPTIPVSPLSPHTDTSDLHHRRMKSMDALSASQILEDTALLPRSRSDSNLPTESLYRQPTLLLVDDKEVNLKLLHMFVARRCYPSITLARDGAQAVTAYEQALESDKPIDIIFMDISMRVMDGFEATKNVRVLEKSYATQRNDQSASRHQALIVAITGNASAKDQGNAFTHGMDLYMTKPVSLKETGKLLQQWEAQCKEHGADGAREAMLAANAAPMG